MSESYNRLDQGDGSHVAYRNTNVLASKEHAPVVLFLGGFYSNMDGSKAQFLHDFCEVNDIAFIRFDYRGHGLSSGNFTDLGISDWLQDAAQVAKLAGTRPIIIVGSSMGGWIGLRLAQLLAPQVEAYIGIAAAPDFTEDGFWAQFTQEERDLIMTGGIVALPSGYPDPYPIGQSLITQGRENLVLRDPLHFGHPVHLFYGGHDEAVTLDTTLKLYHHIDAKDVTLEVIKAADHGFSRSNDLARLGQVVRDFVARADRG